MAARTRIQEILQQIHELNEELREHLRQQQEKATYQLKGKRVEFEKTIRAQHKRLKKNLIIYLAQSEWRHVLSAPFIYGLVFPMLLLDISLLIYQQTCFRLYRIKLVKRADYVVFDHQHLRYLNLVEKINCLYCSYGNGLFAYAREIASLTEQYWCPIKHAKKIVSTHERYPAFLEYGDAEEYQKKVESFRKQLIVSDRDSTKK